MGMIMKYISLIAGEECPENIHQKVIWKGIKPGKDCKKNKHYLRGRKTPCHHSVNSVAYL